MTNWKSAECETEALLKILSAVASGLCANSNLSDKSPSELTALAGSICGDLMEQFREGRDALAQYFGQGKPNREAANFDLFRLTASKREVNISPNTIRSYHAQGLKFYREGKCVFVSKCELMAFIKKNK